MHTHKIHEELYFFSGKGEFQIYGQIISVGEGSVFRVAPDGRCSVRNIGNIPLVMLCIQYKAHSFISEDAADVVILNEKVE